MHKKSVDLVVLALNSPIKIGIYEDKKLIDSIVSEEKSSDILPQIYGLLDERYEIKKIFYANGPGSFMAIKIAYIFLKSISVLKNIPFFAIDAFYFNENKPIKAVGKLYFVKNTDTIETKKFEGLQQSDFTLPDFLNYSDFNTDTVPKYGIGAV